MNIPKYPKVPDLTDKQIDEITKIVFCEEEDLKSSELIFVFTTTHPGSFQNALEAYNKGLGKEMIVSGGTSGSNDKHKDWTFGDTSEARIAYEMLISNGVPVDKMFLEDKSTNTKENVIYSKNIYDFSNTTSLIFISKNYAAGRQYRTLRKYLPKKIKMIPFGYNVYIDNNTTFDRHDWMIHAKSRSLVFGEYLRIVYYGQRGDIEAVDEIVEGLEEYIKTILKDK